MRRALAFAGLGIVASLLATAAPASACDPDTFPNCQTHCAAVASRYEQLAGSTDRELPPWPRTGVAGCP